MKSILVVYPKTSDKAYEIAAHEFVKYFKEATGFAPELATTDDNKSDLVLIGAPAVNTVTAKLMLDDKISPLDIATSTDDFAVKTQIVNDRKILLIQGGLGRSTLYGVYAYFEKFGCAWFWDGDIVPKQSFINVWGKEIDIKESTPFKYRGLRYFAHRGCKRFQAEMWDFDDWKREIDYLVKRRLNLFMLRIGNDDLFQKAFPDDVKYPTEQTMNELAPYAKGVRGGLDGGYNDRRLFWSLEYRGKLRKKVLSYAFDRGLMSPEDCGTMTHWYSTTPKDFLDSKKPKLFSDDSGYGSNAVGQVWDIREDAEFQYYMQLTKTHVREYGNGQLFHTIGFAERMFYQDRRRNFNLKKYVYDRYLQELKKEYPNSPVLLASWDLWLRYTSIEVQSLVSSLDDSQSVIFDYTSDSSYENNFTKWNVVNNFPYVFGIFHAYANFNDCLGFYKLTEERMKVAKADKYCQGVIFWPELSHSDTLMQEFFTRNTWGREVVSVDECIERMCKTRYQSYSEKMLKIWKLVLPVITLMHWNMRNDEWFFPEYYFFELLYRYLPFVINGANLEEFADGMDIDEARKCIKYAKECVCEIAKLPKEAFACEFIVRDITDILRTIVARYINVNLILEGGEICEYRKGKGEKEKIFEYANNAKKLLLILAKLLSTHSDFSLYNTLKEIDKSQKIYDNFERTLKNNSTNRYCRTAVFETVKEVFIPEMEEAQNAIKECMLNNCFDQRVIDDFKTKSIEIVEQYLEKPLAVINQEKSQLSDVIVEIKTLFESLKFYKSK